MQNLADVPAATPVEAAVMNEGNSSYGSIIPVLSGYVHR